MLQLVKEEALPQLNDIVEVPTDDPIRIFKICLEMQQICEKENGIGLSAVQVGLPWNLFVIRETKNHYNYYIDCKYETTTNERYTSLEGCLSIRSSTGHLRHFQVERWKEIKVIGKILSLKKGVQVLDFTNTYNLPLSVVFQHEIDHGLSILIRDIGREIFLY